MALTQVTALGLPADVIEESKIADDGIDSEHYNDGSIDEAHIADNQISLAKMAGLARGKIIYGDASGDPAALTVGSANQVLTSDGTDIAWAAGASGSSADGCIWKNTLTISNAHTIAATEGAHSVGPITLSATVTVNGRWVIS